jgi:hypothetical protein
MLWLLLCLLLQTCLLLLLLPLVEKNRARRQIRGDGSSSELLSHKSVGTKVAIHTNAARELLLVLLLHEE